MFPLYTNSMIIVNFKVPLLDDKIMKDSAITMLKSETQGNSLGKDYRKWGKAGCAS